MARWNTENIIRIGIAAVLGGIGGAAGFKHTHDWAAQNGQHGWLAWAVAVVVEGIAVVAGFEIRRDHRRGHHKKLTFPLAVLVIGFGIQMAAQVANAPASIAGWLLAAIPALGFLIVVKLLMRSAGDPTTPPNTGNQQTTSQPAVSTVTAPSSPLLPADVAAPTMPLAGQVSRVKLPPVMVEKITVTLESVRAAGREPTIDDIRDVVRLPESLAAQVLADLSSTPTQRHLTR